MNLSKERCIYRAAITAKAMFDNKIEFGEFVVATYAILIAEHFGVPAAEVMDAIKAKAKTL